MAIINEFSNVVSYTRHDGTMRISFLAEKIAGAGTTPIGTISFFSFIVDAPDEGMEWLLDTMKSPNKNVTNLFNQKGTWNDTSTQEDKVEERTGDMTFRANAVFNTGKATGSSAEQKDLIVGVLRGLVFDDGKGDKWKVIGTNGVRKLPHYEYRKDIASFTKIDSMLMDTQASEVGGKKVRYKNHYLRANSKSALSIMLELQIATDLGEQTVYRFPCVLASNVKMTENGEANTYTFTYNYLTEAQISEKALVEGIDEDGSEKVELTSADVVDSDSQAGEEIGIEITNGSGVITASTLTLVDGSVIYLTDLAKYIVVYDDNGTLKAVRWTGDGTTLTDYFLDMYQFDDSTEAMEPITV